MPRSGLGCGIFRGRQAAVSEDPRPGHPGSFSSGVDDALRLLGAEVDAALRTGAMRCGPYTLLHVIGEGGFGVVHAASQDGSVRREVAIKILKPGIASRDVLRRFALEQRVLARIQHDCVATILDSGMSDDGRPWFAMPLLVGDPLVAGCDRALLTLEERLEIFAMACDGVHAAHVHGIVHRDLKPANILLVAASDGSFTPKVIDFGIAKAVDASEGITATVDRRRLGTPAYMAPEQLQDGSDGADVRSDVYALGMVLAELVAGVAVSRGSAPERGDHRPVELPSESVERVRRKDRAAADRAARDRGLETSLVLARRLEGDIDAIVARATQREPSLRYASADGLAADVRRMLGHEPVLARKRGAGYVALRFFQRNPGAVTLSALAIVAILGLAAAAAVFAIRAERGLRAAEGGKQRADQVAEFMRTMLDGVDAELLDGRDASIVTDMLAAASARLRITVGTMDPVAAAQIADAIARAYVSFEDPDRALMLLSAVDARLARARAAATRHPEIDSLSLELARLRVAQGLAQWELRALSSGEAKANWRSEALHSFRRALDLLESTGQLEGPMAAVSAIRLWYAREAWPVDRDFNDFEAWVTRLVDRLPNTDPSKWQFQLRRVEIDNWIGILRNYPPLLEGFRRAFGEEHPMVIRSRCRYVEFVVSAAVESRGAWMEGVPTYDDAALRSQLGLAARLGEPLVAASTRAFGSSHSQTFRARLWWLAARGYVEGPETTRDDFERLRSDIHQAKGAESVLLLELNATWKGVSEGIEHGVWWK